MLDLSIIQNNISHSLSALVDSGAQGDFIHEKLVKNLGLSTRARSPLEIKAVDGKQVGILKQESVLDVSIGDYTETRVFGVTNLGRWNMILGMPWLTHHDPFVSWTSGVVSLRPVPPDTRTQLTIGVVDEQTPPVSIPKEYLDLIDVFDAKEADVLPPHRPYDCKIDLVPGAEPSVGNIYNLSGPELVALKTYLDDALEKGFIRHSTSRMGSPIFFVKKKSGELRPVVDYRKLNSITVKNSYPLPLITEILDRLSTAKVFTKLDLRGAYNLVRIRDGDEWKTAFRTKYGLFESLVMNFGLQNAPATFMHFINDVFRDIIDVYIVCYLDDLLIYSDSLVDHVKHVREVLLRLRQHRLYAKMEKCDFHVSSVEFLGFIISTSGVEMDPKKVDAVTAWPAPMSVKSLQRFIGFANFYRRFIRNFSIIARPLHKLCSPKNGFVWSEEAETAFARLKAAFVAAPVLLHPDVDRPFVVETDSSGFGLGAVLSQKFDDKLLHPVGFLSRSLSPAERNYDIHDKELLAVKAAFEEWRHLLEGASFKIVVFTDTHFFKKLPPVLSGRHARWLLFFSRFDFELIYRDGQSSRKPDALSRSVAESPPDLSDVSAVSVLLGASTLDVSSWSSPFLDEFRSAIPSNEFGSTIIGALDDPLKFPAVASRQDFSMFRFDDGLLFYGEKFYVPERMRVIVLQNRHDSPLAGHPGVKRTLEFVSRDYWFPGMRGFVSQFVSSCDHCKTWQSSSSRSLWDTITLARPSPSLVIRVYGLCSGSSSV